jgi:hypothetical protein
MPSTPRACSSRLGLGRRHGRCATAICCTRRIVPWQTSRLPSTQTPSCGTRALPATLSQRPPFVLRLPGEPRTWTTARAEDAGGRARTRDALRVGVHWDTETGARWQSKGEAEDDESAEAARVCQVFCSAVPLAYVDEDSPRARTAMLPVADAALEVPPDRSRPCSTARRMRAMARPGCFRGDTAGGGAARSSAARTRAGFPLSRGGGRVRQQL